MSILMENGTQMMFEELSQAIYHEQNVGVSDFPVRTLASQENNTDLKEIAQVCFSELQTLLNSSKKKIDPTRYSLKMFAIYFLLIEDSTSQDFSLSWTRSGTMRSGKLSTRNTTVYHKTESECSLLDILEDEVDEKYFLSREQAEKIVFAK